MTGRPDEWFGAPRTGTVREQMVAAARDVIGRGTTPNGIGGIKLFPQHLQLAVQHLRFTEWFPDAVWIRMVRRDLVGQAISLWRADSTSQWHRRGVASAEANLPEAARPMPPCDSRAIDVSLKQLAAWDADWSAFFARTGITPLTFTYEDVTAEPSLPLRSVAAALDVALPPDITLEAPRLLVQRGEATERIRAQYHAELGDPDRSFRLILPDVKTASPGAEDAFFPRTPSNLVRLLRGRRLRPR